MYNFVPVHLNSAKSSRGNSSEEFRLHNAVKGIWPFIIWPTCHAACCHCAVCSISVTLEDCN